MPIILPEEIPASATLRAEGVPVIAAGDPRKRVLEIGLINLMPDKPATETQLARLLGAAPQTSRLSLYWPQGENSRRTRPEHLGFYTPLDELTVDALDALIITGAPVEHLPFAQVRYWPQIAAAYDAARAAGIPTLNICWAAMAALFHHRGVAKRGLSAKAFGVFDQVVRDPAAVLMQGLPGSFPVPVSRHAHVTRKAIEAAGVAVLAESGETGPSVAFDAENHATLLFDHLEYDAGTLLAEFLRDRQAALPTPPPSGLALGSAAAVPWRPAAHLLLRNWLADVARKAEARRPRDLLDWLLAREDAMPADDTVVAVGGAGPEMFAAIAAAAAALGVPVAAMRRRAVDGSEAVAVTLDGEVAAAGIARFTRRLLETGGVRRVLHRQAGLNGAALVAPGIGKAA